MIYIGADHRGFEKKNELFKYLKAKGLEIKDVGPYSYDPDDNYNDVAITVARNVRREKESRGILICGSAHGMVIQANRFKGVRAITATEPELIKLGREHNDANILCLSADFLSDVKMQELIRIFLNTKAILTPRYVHRSARLDEREDYA